MRGTCTHVNVCEWDCHLSVGLCAECPLCPCSVDMSSQAIALPPTYGSGHKVGVKE